MALNFIIQVYTIQGSLVNSSNSSSGSSGLNSIGGPVIFSTQLQQGSPDFTNNPLFKSSRQKSRLSATNGYYPNVPVIITPAEGNFNPASDDDSDDQVASGYLHPLNLKHGRESNHHQNQHHHPSSHQQQHQHHSHHQHKVQGQTLHPGPHVTVEPIQHPLVGSGDRHLVLQVDTLPTGNRSTHDLFFAVLFLCFIGFLVSACDKILFLFLFHYNPLSLPLNPFRVGGGVCVVAIHWTK